MSTTQDVLTLGEYIALIAVPLVLLTFWLFMVYYAVRHPEWRRGTQDQPRPLAGPDEARLGRAVPGPLPVPVQPAPGAEERGEDRPGTQSRR